MMTLGDSCFCGLCRQFGGHDEARSKAIEKELKKDGKIIKRQVKILLLGSGESGKSTLMKQMVIIHGRGDFTGEEVTTYRSQIFRNVVCAMRVLLDARQKMGFAWREPHRQSYGERVMSFNCGDFTADSEQGRSFGEIAPLIGELWQDEAIRSTFERRNLFQITDNCCYFFDHIERLALTGYYPTNKDILMCRKASRGITEHVFHIQNVPFRFIDVGGQRSQRQKWFQCFEDITSILFLVATSEYDQVLLEDRKTNRLMESRHIFETIVNNRSFFNVSIILFLNKIDLLKEKISKSSNIRQYFADFHGNPESLQDVQRYILAKFENVRREPNSSKKQPFFYHLTTAVDTENIRRVFEDCRQAILARNLKSLMMH